MILLWCFFKGFTGTLLSVRLRWIQETDCLRSKYFSLFYLNLADREISLSMAFLVFFISDHRQEIFTPHTSLTMPAIDRLLESSETKICLKNIFIFSGFLDTSQCLTDGRKLERRRKSMDHSISRSVSENKPDASNTRLTGFEPSLLGQNPVTLPLVPTTTANEWN